MVGLCGVLDGSARERGGALLTDTSSIYGCTPVIPAPVGVFADASQSRHWPRPWSEGAEGVFGGRFEWKVFHEDNRGGLLNALGGDGKPRSLACVVIASAALQLDQSRSWLQQDHVVETFRSAIDSGMGLVILPSRIAEDASPFLLSLLPYDSQGTFVHARPEKVPSSLRIPEELRKGLFTKAAVSDYSSTGNTESEMPSVLSSFEPESDENWKSLLKRKPMGKSGDVFLSRSTRGRIAVSTLQLDLAWQDLLLALIQRSVRPSGLLIVSTGSRVARMDRQAVRRWMRVIPESLHAATTESRTESGAPIGSYPGANEFSHLVLLQHKLPDGKARRELVHRIENGGSATYVVGHHEPEILLSVRGEPQYLQLAREAECRMLERKADVDATMFNLLAFALTAETARGCISDPDMIPSLFVRERVSEIVFNAFLVRTAASRNRSIDDLLVPTIYALLALATLGDLKSNLGDRRLPYARDIKKAHNWAVQEFQKLEPESHGKREVLQVFQRFHAVCGLHELSDEFRQWFEHEASVHDNENSGDNVVFKVLRKYETSTASGKEIQIDSVDLEDLETSARLLDQNFEAMGYAYLLLMGAAKAQPLGALESRWQGAPGSTTGTTVVSPESGTVKDQDLLIMRLRNQVHRLENEYEYALKSSKVAWGVLVPFLGVLLASLLTVILISDWQIKNDPGLYFGLGAALIVVASILVQRMQWYRRKEMVPGWLWTIIRILGLFRGQNSDDRSPPAASDT